MFTIDDPAENIGDLTNWLAEHDRSDYLYRGQTRDYPVMVPSFFRNLVSDLSDPSPIAKIAPNRLDNLSRQGHARLDMLNRVIGVAGIGLGNIIAQQYGLTSESLDVTESIDVASFFATRRYPCYGHVEEGVGVIYRFDSSAGRSLRLPFSLSELDDLFERGKSDVGFFDFFVKEREKDRIFERDQWADFQQGKQQIVSTIALATSWRDLKAAIDAQGTGLARDNVRGKDPLAIAINELDWERTRFASQHGGFIRPALLWDSLVPEQFNLVKTRAEMARAYGGISIRLTSGAEDPGPIKALPLIIPSSAIKQRMIGVENLRARPDCQAFFFRHGPTRATPMSRRHLWPEPSEDPLYGALWHDAIPALICRHYPDDIPPVDDPDHGLLDRGYRVASEKASRDARELDDLYRGELEDVEEAIASFGATPQRHAVKGWLLLQLGRPREAVPAFVQGLRADRSNISLLVGLTELFRTQGKHRWASKTVGYAARLDPDDLRVIEAQSHTYIDALEFAAAAAVVDRAMKLVDARRDWRENARLVYVRILLAELLNDQELSAQLREMARKEDISLEGLAEFVLTLRAQKDVQSS